MGQVCLPMLRSLFVNSRVVPLNYFPPGSGLSSNGKELVYDWLNGDSPFTPSWVNLLTAMRASGLGELSFTIEQFLYTVPSTASLPVEKAGKGRRTWTHSIEQGELSMQLVPLPVIHTLHFGWLLSHLYPSPFITASQVNRQ